MPSDSRDRPDPDNPRTGGKPAAETRVKDLDAIQPDAISPVERTDADGTLPDTGYDRDSGAGAAGGRSASPRGGREPDARRTADDLDSTRAQRGPGPGR